MTKAEEILTRVQKEQKEWFEYNFGDGSGHFQEKAIHQPLLGIIEEMGELSYAVQEGIREEIEDAIPDVIIFMSGYCSGHELSLYSIYSAACDDPEIQNVSVMCGKLAHSALKYEQKIRNQDKRNIYIALVNVVRHLVATADAYSFDLTELVETTWNKVKQRDWRKNASTAGV